VLAQLDGVLAEVVPVRGSDAGGDITGEQGAYVVRPAEARSVWLRCCRLLSTPQAPAAASR
jgi:hypothetical protein